MKFLSSEKLSAHKYKTPEGYLICTDAILARTGKQTYRKSEVFTDSDDDSEIEVDRTPEEVFSEATLASFENKPITVEHPNENVSPENYNDLSVGFVRDVRRGKVNGQDVILGTLVITDARTIEEIENGEHTDLSCGYDCDIIDEAHPQQRNIRGNHVALCTQGRAGIARIVDSINNIHDSYIIQSKYNTDNYFGNDGYFHLNKHTAMRFNTYEEATKKARALYTDWQEHVNIVNDSIDNSVKDAYVKKIERYGKVDIWQDEQGQLYADFTVSQSGKHLKRLNTSDINKAKKIIDDYVSFLDDSIKDSDYVINFRNNYAGFKSKFRVFANSAKNALKEFAKEVSLRGWGTRNVDIISISPNDGNMRLYGNLYDLLKTIDDSIKDSSYYVDVSNATDREIANFITLAQNKGFSTVDKGHTIILTNGNDDMLKQLKNQMFTTSIKFIDSKNTVKDKAIPSALINELNRKLEEFKRRGYDEEDLKIKVEGNKIWFTGELSYNTQYRLAEELDKILQKYNKDAYFDAETSGRWFAVYDSIIKDNIETIPLRARQEMSKSTNKVATLLGILNELQEEVDRASDKDKAIIKNKANKILNDLKQQFNLTSETYIKLDDTFMAKMDMPEQSLRDSLVEYEYKIIDDVVKSCKYKTTSYIIDELNKQYPGFVGSNMTAILDYLNSKNIKDSSVYTVSYKVKDTTYIKRIKANSLLDCIKKIK